MGNVPFHRRVTEDVGPFRLIIGLKKAGADACQGIFFYQIPCYLINLQAHGSAGPVLPVKKLFKFSGIYLG